MNKRPFGKTGFMISEIALGTWQLGSKWGLPFNHDVAVETLNEAIKQGVNAFDTADVYVGGMSEKTIGEFQKNQDVPPFVITKIGRKLNPHTHAMYTEENLRKFILESRERLQKESLDMVLLHCPPSSLYDDPRVFGYMDQFKHEGLITHYGVSVETVDEALSALNYPGVEAIEVIFNMFRLKPAEVLFEQAKKQGVGIIVRVPLASGLLTGKYDENTYFNPNDHRTFNREGQSFDKGETFSGVDYQLGLKAVSALKKLFNTDQLAPIALRYILMYDAVSTVIPGASRPEQIKENVKASEMKPLTQEEMDGVKKIYDMYIKPSVHHLW